MKEVIEKISKHISCLQEIVGTMIFNGTGGSSIVELLSRVLDIGNVSLLYSGELSLEELNMVCSTLVLSENLLKTNDENDIEKAMQLVTETVDKIERLYREKNLLLGHESDQKIKCA